MHPDIEKAVQVIDSKILELQRAKQTLVEVFGETSVSSKIQPSLFPIRKPFSRGKGKGPTRRDTLINFLEEKGPCRRSEIYKNSGIPQGTVANLLTDKKLFISIEGKWHLVGKEKGKGLTESHQ